MRLKLNLTASDQNVVDDSRRFDSRQSTIQPLMLHRETPSVNPDAMEHRRVQIPNVDNVLNRVVTKFVGRSVRDSALDSSAGHPHRETFDVVIPPGAALALKHRRAAEFSAPDNQRVIEHASLFEVGQQRPCRTVGQFAARIHVLNQAAVVIPASMVEMNKPHASLSKSSSQQAV